MLMLAKISFHFIIDYFSYVNHKFIIMATPVEKSCTSVCVNVCLHVYTRVIKYLKQV